MRVQVADRLYFGDQAECHAGPGDTAIVHACKHPCHRHALGYTNSLPASHPHYLSFEEGNHLYLNMIDPDRPMFMMPTFVTFLSFVDRQIVDRVVLIHCNQGRSRSASLALLYMAKRLKLLPDTSYEEAAHAFSIAFPYSPGAGIATWLSQNWDPIAVN